MSAPLSAGSSGGSPSASGRKLSTASTPSSKKQRTIDFTFSQQNSNGHKRPIVPKMQNRNQSVQLIRPVGAKKLLIKNLREYAPQAKREYFTKSREQVMKAVDDVLDDKKPHLPLEKLYRDVEDLVKEGAGEELYGLLKAKLQSYLRDFTKYAIKDGDVTGMGMSYLANALDYWKRWLDKLVRCSLS